MFLPLREQNDPYDSYLVLSETICLVTTFQRWRLPGCSLGIDDGAFYIIK